MSSRSLLRYPFTFPIAAVAISSLVLTPVTMTPTPHALAAELVASSQRAVHSVATAATHVAAEVGSTVDSAAVSAAGLLASEPALLGSVSVHDLATFIALPQASAPLLSKAVTSSNTGAATLRAAADVAIAASPTADLVAALQSIVGAISTAVSTGPGDVLKSLGLLLDGNVRDALSTLSSIVLTPLFTIGLFDLPNVSAALSQLFPPLAPIFTALPTSVIDVTLPILQVVLDVNDGIASTFEAARDGLKNGDIGAAVSGLLSSIGNATQTTLSHLLGTDGLISGLSHAGGLLSAAIGKVIAKLFKPPAPATASIAATEEHAALASSGAVASPNAFGNALGSSKSVGPGEAAPSSSHATVAGSTVHAPTDDDATAGTATGEGQSHSEGTSADSGTETAKDGQATSSDSAVNGSASGSTKTGSTTTGSTTTGSTKTGSTTTGSTTTGSTKAGSTKAGSTTTGTTKTGSTSAASGTASSSGASSSGAHDDAGKKATSGASKSTGGDS